MSSSASLVAALSNIRAQAQELSGLIQANQKAKLRNWEQEREQKQQLISSLTQSQDILRKEKARVRAELKAQLAKQAPPPKPPANSSSWEAAGDVVDLQTKLIDLNNRLLDIDLGLKAVVAELQTCRQQDTEDTKRILQGEIDGLRANIFQIESIARREEDRKTFSTGGSGVYIAARDLFLSEVSSFLSGLSKRKDKLRSLINSSGSSSSSSSAPPSSFSPSSGHPPTDLQPSPQPGPLSPQQPLGSGLGSRGSGGGAQAEGGRARGVGGEGGSSGLSLGQRMHRLRDGLGQRMERMKDSVEDSVRAEAVQERVGRMREGVRDMSLEGVKEAVGGRVDRMKGGLQEGVQESWGKLSKMVKVMGSKGQGQGAASPQPGQTASGQDLALSPLQQGALPGEAPGQGGQPEGAMASSRASPGPQGAAQGLLSVAFQDFEGRPSRKGVYVQVLGGEVSCLLEVEVALNVVVEWSALEGWQIPESRPLDFTILQLDHQMQGNNIPLPRTALKGLLNMFLPSVLSKVVLGLLPPELGKYVVESGEAQRVHGEFRIMGQPLTTYMADIAPFTKPPDGSKRALWQQQQAAGAQARGLMGLSEQQAQ
ncbi:hypothetical protein QJQ45_029084, partial [Haematococcus lacustris]